VASRVIQVPIKEMLCPLKYSRKFRCRSERQAREMPGLVTTEEFLGKVSRLTTFYCAT